MSAPQSALSPTYQPATFIERGVAVPFTTPALAGARARPAERGGGAELVVPNPSGAQGFYVLPWMGVRELCRPTVHDERLNQHVELLPTVTPVTLRAASRAVAAEGLAGREASAAAAAADAADRQEHLLANYMLLLALLRQTEPADAAEVTEAALALSPTTAAELERRARLVAVRIVPRLDRPGAVPEDVSRALDGLAHLYAGIGVGVSVATARLTRATTRLRRLRDQLDAWASVHADDPGQMAAAIGYVANTTIDLADASLAAARTRTEDMVGLVRDWLAAPLRLTRLTERPDWLLDGWSALTAIWDEATDEAARRAALAEMILLAPTLPREASDWAAMPIQNDALLRCRRMVRLNEEWRSGVTILDRVARNEALHAQTI